MEWPTSQDPVHCVESDWDDVGGVVSRDDVGEVHISPSGSLSPGGERGLVSRARFGAVELAFEVLLTPAAYFLAKIHQQDRLDQCSNSYHLLSCGNRAYIARHNYVFKRFELGSNTWHAIRLRRVGHELSVHWSTRFHRVNDIALSQGYAFLGAQGGAVRLRRVRLTPLDPAWSPGGRPGDEALVVQPITVSRPRVSIITTVYDRTDCLRRCIDSVRQLTFGDYEHIIVSDCPPSEHVERIRAIVATMRDDRIGYFNLQQRHNDWGIAPAAAGLRLARGVYVCFLSDDNGYTPDHLGNLVLVLDQEPEVGFAYSSCLYDGRRILREATPRPARIDLGQPLFRRELFELHFDKNLSFTQMAWDWHMIETLIARGVRWRHVDSPTFIFRLVKYPHLIATPHSPRMSN